MFTACEICLTCSCHLACCTHRRSRVRRRLTATSRSGMFTACEICLTCSCHLACCTHRRSRVRRRLTATSRSGMFPAWGCVRHVHAILLHSQTFAGATSFNSDISKWCVSSVGMCLACSCHLVTITDVCACQDTHGRALY